MRIQHNIAALNSYRQLGTNNTATSKNLEKLSSGYKINRAGDDAAGLAISEKMRAQITGLEKAQDNANDGISLVQTAEGALTEVHSMLNRMVELAEQSANGTYDDTTDRANLQKEISSLSSEIDRISEGTNFNGLNLLDGTMGLAMNGNTTIEETNISFGAGKKSELTSVTMNTAAGSAKGISVDVTTSSTTVAITFGTKDEATSYTAAEITAAVRKAAQDEIDAATSSTDADDLAHYKELATNFTAYADDKISFEEDQAAASSAIAAAITDSGKGDNGLTLQIGDTSDSFNKLSVVVGNMNADSLGIGDIDISTQEGASNAVDLIKAAINKVSSTRGDIGAIQNRLEHTINNLGVTTENVTAAESRIRDVDMAEEMMNYTKNNILIQASQSMLAQANQLPQGVLQLLQ